MSQNGEPDLNKLLEGITTKIGEFTAAIMGSTRQLDNFSSTIDKKIGSLNENISSLTNIIKEEDKVLTENLHGLITSLKSEIKSFKDEVNISEIKDILGSIQKVIKTPERSVINKNVDKVLKEVLEITQQLKKQG